MRKGQSSGVDFSIAVGIFIVTLASATFLAQSHYGQEGISEPVERAAVSATEILRENVSRSFRSTALVVDSDYTLQDEPLLFRASLPSDADRDSMRVVRGDEVLPSDFRRGSNLTVFVSDIQEGKNVFHLIYTGDDIPGVTYGNGVSRSGSTVSWSDLSVTFTDAGFSSVDFRDLEVLNDSADLGPSSSPSFSTGNVSSNVSYSEDFQRFVKIFNSSGQVRVRSVFSGDRTWIFNLTSNFTEMYSSELGGTRDLDGGGDIYAGTTDFVDFHDVRGIGFVARDMEVDVDQESGDSSINVVMRFPSGSAGQTRKDILIYLHDGSHANILDKKNEFLDPKREDIGVSGTREGVSKERANSLESMSYGEVRRELALGDLHYNISIGDFLDLGRELGPRVVARDTPVAVIGGSGNLSETYMQVRVWR